MSTSETTKVTQEYRNIPIGQLKESSTNPRKRFDDAGLAELAESIRSKGVLLPLLVRPRNGHYEIVTGERRYRASKLAGCGTVPATVRELTDDECLENPAYREPATNRLASVRGSAGVPRFARQGRQQIHHRENRR